jgi:hypothetical protein
MKPLWESYMSWSDCGMLTRQMGQVQDRIVKSLASGMHESGILKNHDFLSVELLTLLQMIERVREKKPKDDPTK